MEDEERDDREDERCGVDQERGAGAEGVDNESADRGSEERERRLADELREGVRLHEQVLRDEVRDDRPRSRPLERLARAEERREDEYVPELERLGNGEDSEQADRGAA